MKINWLLLVAVLVLLIQACKKQDGANITENTEYPPVTTPPINVPQNQSFTVSNVLKDNMVVQRDKPFIVWGTSAANAAIKVNASWAGSAVTATADNKGNWKAAIPAAPANTNAQTLTIKTKDQPTVTLKNIVIGDVWICSGQSNMVYPMDMIYPFRGVVNYSQEIAAANYPLIRMMTVADDHESSPLSNLTYVTGWDVCSPQTVGKVSGVAYYFALKLHTTLNVPIGIIVSAVNGTSCETWANDYVFKNDNYLASAYGSGSQLYNGMIAPLTNLGIKGFTWYQGENNQHNTPVSNYTRLNSALILGWRNAFNQGALPFYLVQMTPFAEDYFNTTPLGGDQVTDYYAKFREAQANVLSTPGTGMAVTMDVGEPENHHPMNKKPVGERLALLALNKTYGMNVQCVGPQYSSFTQSGNTVVVNFVAGTANGLNTINNAPLDQYFFVAGADHVFRQAMASINGNTVVLVVQPGTPTPIQAVRYAFTSAPVTNLQNSAGLPAEPFRTDNW